MSATVAKEGTIQSESIGELCSHLTQLETRIFGGELPPDRLLTPDTLKGILRRATASHGIVGTSGGKSAVRLDLSGTVKQIIESDEQIIGADRLLSIRDASLLQIVESLFRYLEYEADLDPYAYGAIQYLQVSLAQLLITNPAALDSAGHPARSFLERVVGACRSYDRHAGPKAAVLLEQVKRLVAATLYTLESPESSFSAADRDLTALLDGHDREILELSRDMIAKEQVEVKSSDAKLAVNWEILSAVTGKTLPLVLLQFLQQIWNKYLYITFLRHGMHSEQWRQGVEDIVALVDSASIRNRDDLFKFYTDGRAKALARIRVGTASIQGDEELGKRFFATLDAIHKKVGEGKKPKLQEIEVPPPDDIPRPPPNRAGTSGSHIPLQHLRVGHWYKLLDRGLEVRCRLIEKNTENHYCLFSNFSGIKTARKSWPEVAEALQNNGLKKIDTAPVFAKAAAFACGQIAEQIPRLEARARKSEQERDKILQQKHQAQAQAELHRKEEERLREEARLLEESHQREQKKAQQQTESRVEAQRQARQQALQQVLVSVNRMQPGGLVELIGNDNRKINCKLGLKIKSSGKLIFIDRLGRKVDELLPEQLAERIINGSASISDYGVAFDDTLGRLITDRSEQVNVE